MKKIWGAISGLSVIVDLIYHIKEIYPMFHEYITVNSILLTVSVIAGALYLYEIIKEYKAKNDKKISDLKADYDNRVAQLREDNNNWQQVIIEMRNALHHLTEAINGLIAITGTDLKNLKEQIENVNNRISKT
jgi:hypothetical protein